MKNVSAMTALSLGRGESNRAQFNQKERDGAGLWLHVLRAGLLGVLLSGCTQSLPPRAEQDSSDAASSAATATENAEATAAATSDPDTDEPLPWPPPNGEIPMPQEAAAAGKMFEWHGDGRRVSRIVIDTDAQQARFFDNGELVGWSTVATGVSSHRTPTGEFSVLEKVSNKRSNLYGRIYDSQGKLVKRNAKSGRDAVPAGGRFVGASMPHFMRMTFDGVGMHAGPIPRPGSPASHGCIRMPARVADALYRHVDLGTRVTVIGSHGPNYGNYASRVQAERNEARARAAASEAEGGPLEALDAEIAALRGEEFPSSATRPSTTQASKAAASNAAASKAVASEAAASEAAASEAAASEAAASEAAASEAAGAREKPSTDKAVTDDASTDKAERAPANRAGATEAKSGGTGAAEAEAKSDGTSAAEAKPGSGSGAIVPSQAEGSVRPPAPVT